MNLVRNQTTLIVAAILAGCCGCAGLAELQPQIVVEVPSDASGGQGTPLFSRVVRYQARVDPTSQVADIYQPETTGDAQRERFPVVLLFQGANVDPSQYERFAARVAAYGHIVVVPHFESLAGRFANLAATADVLQFLQDQDADPGSMLAERLDLGAVGFLGHSFGGAAVLQAVQDRCALPFCRGDFSRPPALRAVSVYAGDLKDPISGGPIDPVDNDGIPVQVIFGTLDGVADPENATETFQQVLDGPKQQVAVAGANHYGITDVNNPPGAAADPNSPSVLQSTANETIARWTGLFLRAHLSNDSAALSYLAEQGADLDPNVDMQYVVRGD